MNRFGLAVLVAALSCAAVDAQAQNFFERLFGLTPSRPQPPPIQPQPSRAAPPSEAPAEEAPRRTAPAAPAAPRPMAVKAPNEDAILGKELKQNGSTGSLKLERTPRGDLRIKLSVVGRRSSQSPETCTVPVAEGDGTPLVSQGKPEGAPRYQLQDPTCPLQIDILDEAVLVKGPTDVCTFQARACQVDPSGMWGPEPAQVASRARDFEQVRGSVDKAVRENYKVLAQRARPEAARPIVAEQAAFSSDREMVCRSYARESSTSFCNAKFTEARALSLATRLGLTIGASTASNEARSRRSRPAGPEGLPSTDELMQTRAGPDDD